MIIISTQRTSRPITRVYLKIRAELGICTVLMSSRTLQLFVIIYHIIVANAIGLIVGSTCLPFESISSHPTTSGQLHKVGWIKVISCYESLHTSNNNTFTIHRKDYLSLSSRTMSIKFQPPEGNKNPKYDNLAVIAKPYSNPMQYALNNAKEASYIYNSKGKIAGFASLQNWIGSSKALARLNNNCHDSDTEYPNDLHERIYHACNNLHGIHIFPNQNGTSIYQCIWEYSRLLGENIEIHFGFQLENCNTE